MNRPDITTFFPEDFTPKDVAKMFQENPELKDYIHALDAYIDHLEDKQKILKFPLPLDDFGGFRVDILPVPFMKKGIAHLLVNPDNYPGKLEIETDHGKIGVFSSKLLKHGEIGIVDLSVNPLKMGGIHFPDQNQENWIPRYLNKNPDQS